MRWISVGIAMLAASSGSAETPSDRIVRRALAMEESLQFCERFLEAQTLNQKAKCLVWQFDSLEPASLARLDFIRTSRELCTAASPQDVLKILECMMDRGIDWSKPQR